jgi:hypothetical protein
MKTTDENKLNAAEAVVLVLANNIAIWTMIAAIMVLFDLLKAKIQLVRDLRQIQEKDNTGVTKRKGNVRKQMEEKGMNVIRKLVMFAVATENTELDANINYTATDLSLASENRVADIIRLVYETANAHKSELAAYGVTDEMLELLLTLHQQFLVAMPETREKLTLSSTATKNINTLITEISDLQRTKLDRLIAGFADTNPDFYQQYKNARKIVDRGIRHEPEEEGK